MAGTFPIDASKQAYLGKRMLVEIHKELDVFNGLTEVITDKDKRFPMPGKPIVIRKDLSFDAGTLEQKIFMLGKLSGDIVRGDETLVGKETPLDQYSQTVAVEQARKASSTSGRQSMKSSPLKLYDYFAPSLKDFMAAYRVKDFVAKLAGATTKDFANVPTAATSQRVLYGGNATSTATIDSADKITPSLVKKAKTLAEKQFITGTDGNYIPPIGACAFGGKSKMFLNLVSSNVYDDYLANPEVQQKFRETGALQKDNPLLMADDIILNGVVTRKCTWLDEPNVGEFTNWGSGADQTGSIALFIGAGALAVSECSDPRFVPDSYDYENVKGMAIDTMFGSQKAKYNGQDLGMITLKVYSQGL